MVPKIVAFAGAHVDVWNTAMSWKARSSFLSVKKCGHGSNDVQIILRARHDMMLLSLSNSGMNSVATPTDGQMVG
jgi:hypothetical protein